jgi:predicted site-specific integrase-resolvase
MPKSDRAQVEYLTTHRVARILSISKKTLHNWVQSGKIPHPPVNPENGYFLWTMMDIEVIRVALREEQN